MTDLEFLRTLDLCHDDEECLSYIKQYRTEQCRKVLLAAADHSIGMFLGAGEYLRKIANDPERLKKLMEKSDDKPATQKGEHHVEEDH